MKNEVVIAGGRYTEVAPPLHPQDQEKTHPKMNGRYAKRKITAIIRKQNWLENLMKLPFLSMLINVG